MANRFLLGFILGLMLLGGSCYMEHTEASPENIYVSPVNSNKIKASELFDYKGFTRLQDAGQQPLRSITKVLFSGNSIIVFDAETDFQDIYRYDVVTGSFINKIGRQSEQEGGYNELYDIDLNAGKDQIVGLSTGNTSFMTYDLHGNPIKQLRNGSLGEYLAVLPNEGYVLYNELGATKISGYNYLVFYDKVGNVVKRAMPYPDSLDNFGYNFSGFLGNTGHDIVFSPPFCDTVFAIKNNKIEPLYCFDFLEKAIPAEMRQQKGNALELSSSVSFLTEGIVKSKNLVLFHYYDMYGPSLGIYDEIKKQFWDANGLKRNDPLYPLIQKGNIFTTGNEQFCLVLDPRNLKSLQEENVSNQTELANTYPDLAKAIQENEKNPAFILLYLEAK